MRFAKAGCLVILLVMGCTKKPDIVGPTGTLKGKLSMGGKTFPVNTGVVFQHVDTGRLYLALTLENGEYHVSKPTHIMPVGKYQLTIQPPSTTDVVSVDQAKDALDGPPGGVPVKPILEIPSKYRNAHESKLTCEVNEGPNEVNFDLKP